MHAMVLKKLKVPLELTELPDRQLRDNRPISAHSSQSSAC